MICVGKAINVYRILASHLEDCKCDLIYKLHLRKKTGCEFHWASSGLSPVAGFGVSVVKQ